MAGADHRSRGEGGLDAGSLKSLLAGMKVEPVDPNDLNRPVLYILELIETQAFLLKKLAEPKETGGLGRECYNFCSPALQNPNLLQSLCGILDVSIQYCVNLQIITLQRAPNAPRNLKIDAAIYRPLFVEQDFRATRDAFLAAFPVTAAAVAKLTANFQTNIRTACERIFADKAILEKFFGVALTRLSEIGTTGSDFHKGGQQVAVLSFTTGNYLTWPSTYKIMYKPSDIQIDCLITGDSKAVNAIIKDFMPASLAEILNVARASLKRVPLPTYKILPMAFLSAKASPTSMAKCYGYIEYIRNATPTSSFYSRYFDGNVRNDFTIGEGITPNGAKLVDQCYELLGTWLALVCTFSLQDLHLENVRIKEFLPYLIDLEVSLNNPVEDISKTLLISGEINGKVIGGIDGYKNDNDHFKIMINDAKDYLETVYSVGIYQNRLWKVDKGNTTIVNVDLNALLRGFTFSFGLIADQSREFAVWWNRVADVVVRDLPYATIDLRKIRNALLDVPYSPHPTPYTFASRLKTALEDQVAVGYANYVDGPPSYLVLRPAIAMTDYQNFDIPVYYRRNGRLNLFNGYGTRIVVNDVFLNGNTTYKSKVDRRTYYGTSNIAVLQAYLANITGQHNAAARTQRLNNLLNQVKNLLNANMPLNPPSVFEQNADV